MRRAQREVPVSIWNTLYWTHIQAGTPVQPATARADAYERWVEEEVDRRIAEAYRLNGMTYTPVEVPDILAGWTPEWDTQYENGNTFVYLNRTEYDRLDNMWALDENSVYYVYEDDDTYTIPLETVADELEEKIAKHTKAYFID